MFFVSALGVVGMLVLFGRSLGFAWADTRPVRELELTPPRSWPDTLPDGRIPATVRPRR